MSEQTPYGGDPNYEPEIADADFFIPLPEVGADVACVVREGTEVPREHAGKPRVSSWPAPERKRRPGV